MNRTHRRRILGLAAGPPGHLKRSNRRNWYNDPRNCPSWWIGKWQSPNHPPDGKGFSAKEEKEILKSLQNFLQRKVYIQI